MKRIILLLVMLAASSASVFCGDRHIAFERNDAVYIANLDGTGEKKITDGIFPAISPDGLASRLTPWRKRAIRPTPAIWPSSMSRWER
jgi:hypothetical protein